MIIRCQIRYIARWIGGLGACALISIAAVAGAETADPKRWIENLATDADRFRALQTYLRGFDQPMWEVGERYRHVHRAILDGNYELAAYHWRKIKVTIENGYMKRPARRPNADAMFLDRAWPVLEEALGSADGGRITAAFNGARRACMDCHDAEDVPYMNRQPLFADTQLPP